MVLLGVRSHMGMLSMEDDGQDGLELCKVGCDLVQLWRGASVMEMVVESFDTIGICC